MIEWINANQGIIELVGLFFIIPFAIISERILSARKKSAHRKELKGMLVKELWINLNYVAQIETSYENNCRDFQNLHIPPPPHEPKCSENTSNLNSSRVCHSVKKMD